MGNVGTRRDERELRDPRPPLVAGPSNPQSPSRPGRDESVIRSSVSDDDVYIIEKKIGEGGFGQVFLTRKDGQKGGFGQVFLARKDGQKFAIKVMKPESSISIRSIKDSEIAIMRSMKHDNIVRYVHYFPDQRGMICLVMDYCENGDLSDAIKTKRQEGRYFEETIAKNWLEQMAKGLEYIHSKNILHRDIKTANVLLHKGVVKIADFGLARQLADEFALATTLCGTIPYMSPEQLLRQSYNDKSDVWAFGCCAYEMLCLKPAVHTINYLFGGLEGVLLNQQRLKDSLLPDVFSKDMNDFVKSIFIIDYQDRPSMAQLLRHRVFSQTSAASASQSRQSELDYIPNITEDGDESTAVTVIEQPDRTLTGDSGRRDGTLRHSTMTDENKKVIELLRMLANLNYSIDHEMILRNIHNGKKFEFSVSDDGKFNQERYDNIGHCVAAYVLIRLVYGLNMQKIIIPVVDTLI